MNNSVRVINAPSEWRPDAASIFMAGGISDWREEFISELTDFDGVILNPYRQEWPVEPKELRRQM